MTKLTTGEKIGLVFGLIGTLVGVMIPLWVAVTDFIRAGGPTVGGGMALGASLVVGGLMWVMFIGPMLKTYILRQRGQPAKATILEVWDTGITINKAPQVGLRLEVHLPGQLPYEAETTAMVSRLNPTLYHPGMRVQVLYDPQNPQRVAIESLDSQPTTESYSQTSSQIYTNLADMPPQTRQTFQQMMTVFNDTNHDGVPDIFEGAPVHRVDLQPQRVTDDPVQRLSQLKELLEAGLITPAEYETKKQEILAGL